MIHGFSEISKGIGVMSNDHHCLICLVLYFSSWVAAFHQAISTGIWSPLWFGTFLVGVSVWVAGFVLWVMGFVWLVVGVGLDILVECMSDTIVSN